MISIGRHFIEFVLLWKFFYQTILWCTFIYNLVWPRIALFNGTSVPIELLITHLKEHYMVHLIFFEKDFQANLLVVKITLITSSTSSEKKWYVVHRTEMALSMNRRNSSTRKWLNLSPPLDVCSWCHMGSFYSSRLLTGTMFYRVAQTRKAPHPQLCPRVTNTNLTV